MLKCLMVWPAGHPALAGTAAVLSQRPLNQKQTSYESSSGPMANTLAEDLMPCLLFKVTKKVLISNGNRTEWRPVRSVIIRVITKSDDRAAGVRFVNHEYDHRPIGRHEVLLPINHKNYNFREKKNSQVMKER